MTQATRKTFFQVLSTGVEPMTFCRTLYQWATRRLMGATPYTCNYNPRHICWNTLFFTHFAPPHPCAILTKHLERTHKCIVPFPSFERGKGGVDKYLVVIIWSFFVFQLNVIRGCRFKWCTEGHRFYSCWENSECFFWVAFFLLFKQYWSSTFRVACVTDWLTYFSIYTVLR